MLRRVCALLFVRRISLSPSLHVSPLHTTSRARHDEVGNGLWGWGEKTWDVRAEYIRGNLTIMNSWTNLFGTVEVVLTSLGLGISGLTLILILSFIFLTRRRGQGMCIHKAEWCTALLLTLVACGRGIYLLLVAVETTASPALDWTMCSHMLMLGCAAHLHLDLGQRYRQYVQSTSSTFRFALLIAASMAYFVAIGSRAAGIVGRGKMEMPYTTLRPICWSMEMVALILGQLYALGLGQRGGMLVGWEKQRAIILCLAPVLLPAMDIPALLPTAGHPASLRYTFLISIAEAFIYLTLANRTTHPWLGGGGAR
ncbi:hypothetical protein BJ684DRAFT_14479 [Piptocephalis cylindrospora]|uniref:Uncharacterized protein n=1 Tax=Piptocephalis cylindrospora TaxID=1907219 RepID=A0A4P9Y7X3_9FUNG|nr:hypothetical protein BJ684DRAFT_14479 [Piptocephalis cylindrospora]|eukprot:RKP15256.1 hypothetical protein BJ684DRAFT_14479 [Piptocephalis cylindrospora]